MKQSVSKQELLQLLQQEMVLATGCTEPSAIALTAAHAAQALRQLGAEPEQADVLASVNIIKNAMAAGIPGSGCVGVPYAAAIGLFGAPEDGLELFGHITPQNLTQAKNLVKTGQVKVALAQVPHTLYIEVTARGGGHFARAVIADQHTRLIRLETDQGSILSLAEGPAQEEGDTPELPSLERIFTFIQEEFDPYGQAEEIVRQGIAVNMAIAEEGLKNPYGLGLGRLLKSSCRKGKVSADLSSTAMIWAAAGADARMAGACLPVVTNSGSGNQGIAATVPVAAAAKWLGRGERETIQACALSNLVAIKIKSQFGRLSALCGATVAGTGAACGIAYLLGGGVQELGYAVQNMIGNVTGMLCDGAKGDCALKISSCTNAAVQAALMAVNGIRVSGTDGIVEEDPEHTIENLASLSQNCSQTIDHTVLNIMLAKQG